jgi:hypothetical protein
MKQITSLSFLSSAMLLCRMALYAQTGLLGGTVRNTEGETLPLVNIVLYDVADSVNMRNHGVSDMEGRYEIAGIEAGDYCVVLSYVGFRTVRDTLHMTGASLRRDYRLETNAELIGEIEIRGQRMTASMEKSTYAILPDDVRERQHALDLLEIIPGLMVDRLTHQVRALGDKPVKLLVNGMNATETELQTLSPQDVLRLEHYEIPPARYAAYETVVNVITRKIESGFTGGITLSHAFRTGFGNDQAYFNYNYKQHQLSVRYFLGYRDHKDQRQDIGYAYSFHTIPYKKETQVQRQFGYDQHVIGLTYTFQGGDHSALQVKFSPNYLNSHIRGESDVDFLAGNETTERIGKLENYQKEFNPVADIYYWHKISDRDELGFNVVGTGFATSNAYLAKEYGGEGMSELLLDNEADEQNRKYSLIGEAYYSRKLNAGRLNAGYSAEAYRLGSHVVNTFGDARFSTSFAQHYLYAEWVGETGKWGYNASFGLSRKETNTYAGGYVGWILRPFFTLQYSMDPQQRLRLSFERKNAEPSIANLSDNKTYITDHIIEQGNPYLRHSISNRAALNYSFITPRFVLTLVPSFVYVESPINSYFMESEEYLVRTSENGNSQRQYGIQYNVRLQPFRSHRLSLTLFGELTHTELFSTYIRHYSHLYKPLGYQVDFSWGNLSAQYQGRIVGYRMNGPYLTADTNFSSIELRYRINDDFSLLASCFWPFTHSKNHTYTIPESLVEYSNRTQIYDSASMIQVGFSWSFSKGKEYSERNRQLQNRDMDSGVFYK